LLQEVLQLVLLQELIHHLRAIMNGIRYRTRTDCAWRLLADDLPPGIVVDPRGDLNLWSLPGYILAEDRAPGEIQIINMVFAHFGFEVVASALG
jgi:hypothetical protein